MNNNTYMSYKVISGIYKILCKESCKVYVGSAVSIKGRWASHRSALHRNAHGNKHLQHAWNKYGEDSFEFSIIEQCERSELVEREQHWIDLLKAANPVHGMNNSPTASTSLGFRHSEKTKRILSEIASARDHSRLRDLATAMRGKPGHSKGKPGKAWTDEQRAAASAARRGRCPWNKGIPMAEDVRAKVSESLLLNKKIRKFDDVLRSEICELRVSGLTLHQISAKTGVSVAQAHRISGHIDVGPRRGIRRH